MEHNFIDETQINFNWYTVEQVSRPCARRPVRVRVGGKCLKCTEFTRQRARHQDGAEGDAPATLLQQVLGQLSEHFSHAHLESYTPGL